MQIKIVRTKTCRLCRNAKLVDCMYIHVCKGRKQLLESERSVVAPWWSLASSGRGVPGGPDFIVIRRTRSTLAAHVSSHRISQPVNTSRLHHHRVCQPFILSTSLHSLPCVHQSPSIHCRRLINAFSHHHRGTSSSSSRLLSTIVITRRIAVFNRQLRETIQCRHDG